MILLPDLIKKLKEIEEYYPNILVNINSLNIHVSTERDEIPISLTFTIN